MASTARMTKRGDALATELAHMIHEDKTVVIEIALEKYYHAERLRLFNEGYSELSKSKKDHKREKQEWAELDGSLMDGLDDE